MAIANAIYNFFITFYYSALYNNVVCEKRMYHQQCNVKMNKRLLATQFEFNLNKISH